MFLTSSKKEIKKYGHIRINWIKYGIFSKYIKLLHKQAVDMLQTTRDKDDRQIIPKLPKDRYI